MVTKCRLKPTNPDERRDQIVSVAASAFADEGYGATSMSSLATRLGGSKATLYKYFRSKGQLFEAVVRQRCDRMLETLRDMVGSGCDDLELLLSGFGTRYLSAIYEPGALDLHRMLHSEGARFPELAEIFCRSGSNVIVEELCFTLEQFIRSGLIVCDDPPLAASQYLGMLRGDRHLRFAVGAQAALDALNIEHHARHAARLFVRGLLWHPLMPTSLDNKRLE